MNSQNRNSNHVEQPRFPFPQYLDVSRNRRSTSEQSLSTLRPSLELHQRHSSISDDDVDHVEVQPTSSQPSQPTVTPRPPPSTSSSSSSSATLTSTSNSNSPDGISRPLPYPPPVVVAPPRNLSNPRYRTPLPRAAVDNLVLPGHATDGTMDDHEAQMNAAMLTGFRDDLAREAGVVTPGVDDTPYIHYAIEQITRRDRDTGYSANDSDSEVTVPFAHYYQPSPVPVPMSGPQQQQIQSPTRLSHSQQQIQSPTRLSHSQQQIQSPTRLSHSQQQRQQQQPLLGSPPPSYPHHDGDQDEITTIKLARYNTTRPLEPFPREQRHSYSERVNDGHEPMSNEKPSHPTRPGLTSAHSVPLGTSRTGPTRMKTSGGTPALQYRPWMLWPTSFIILIFLCLLMLAALIFCAIYSPQNAGLVAYSGTIYSGQYFTFRILPQLLAACILLYAQAIISTMIRILPFIRLASTDRAERERAIYMDLHPRSYLLWPRLEDRWQIWLPMLVTWVLYLAIPLQSALFTVVLVDGTWRWAAVTGVAWTLVGMYLALIFAMGEAGIYWWTRMHHTGLRWDPRAIADIMVMVAHTNVAEQYRGTELAARRSTISFALKHRRVERLGYWLGNEGFVYGLRSMETPTARGFGDVHEKVVDQATGELVYIQPRDLEASAAHQSEVRHRYLPFCLRDGTLIFSVVAGTVLLVALFVVSFLPSTRITLLGFRPSLPAAPEQPGAFSPANFLYSFLPSLIGLLLYLAFQSLDTHLRVLTPWAALSSSDSSSPNGATAQQSILADYASCLPLQTVYRAVRNGHYRLAAISLLACLTIFLPVLAGGVFMALTDATTFEVNMYPNVPVFALVLALLVLYLVGLMALLPHRHALRLPHGVTCLAEIIGFLVNDEVLGDETFRAGLRTRAEMVDRLVSHGRDQHERWGFGIGERDEMLGVRRVRRFTDRRRAGGVRKSEIRRS